MYLGTLRELIAKYGTDATLSAVLAAETALQEKRRASTAQLPAFPSPFRHYPQCRQVSESGCGCKGAAP